MIRNSELENQTSESGPRHSVLISVFRIPISALIAFAISACGFHPLYGTLDSGGPAVNLSTIWVKPIPERVGYVLRNDLLDMFNSAGDPEGAAYRLEIILKTARIALGFTNNAEITRYNFYLTAKYDLISVATNKPVKYGTARIITSYNVVTSPYATVTAEKDAQDRAARDLAETIRTELAVYMHEAALHPGAQATPTPPPEQPEPMGADPSTTP